MRPATTLAAALIASALAVAGCGGAGGTTTVTDRERPTVIRVQGTQPHASADLGFPAVATKNTTRIGGADPVANAAGVARAVFPATDATSRPRAVALLDGRDWRAGVAGAVLAARPIRAALLLSDGRELPAASAEALAALAPTGARRAGGAQLIRVGDVARPANVRTADVAGRDPFALARALDAFSAAARGGASRRVLVTSAEDPAFAMPAAAWSAKSGDPVLYVARDRVPAETRAALAAHGRPRIYLLGPERAASAKVEAALGRLGKVTRIAGPDPQRNAIAFGRYVDRSMGWGVVDPGHGLVFARADAPLDAAAAAPLSAAGTYGPLLLLGDPDAVGAPLRDFLLDIQPGYQSDPVRGVYNHGWIVGDDRAISVAAQGQIDALLEIRRVDPRRRANP
jgi:hypothetical protein